MTGNAPVHPRLTPKKPPSSDIDLIQTFIAKNGVTKPTTAQEERYARKEERARGLLKASDPNSYRFRPGTEAYSHRSTLMSEGFTLDHKWLPLEKLTGEYAEKPPEKPAPAPPPPAEPIAGYCTHCHKSLRRLRAGALYCNDTCRKAAARKAAKFAEANKAFKTDLTIAKNNWLSGEYSYFASSMNHWARNGIEATFWATPGGVLITEELPGAATLVMSTDYFFRFGRYDHRFDVEPDRTLTEHTSRDPKVVDLLEAAVTENMKGACEPEGLGWSIIKKEEEKRHRENCAAYVLKLNGLLTGPDRKVWLLTWSGYSYGHQLARQWVSSDYWPFFNP